MLKRAPHTAEFTSRISPSAKQEVDHSLLVLPLLVCAPRELTQCQVLALPHRGASGCPLCLAVPAPLQHEPDPRLMCKWRWDRGIPNRSTLSGTWVEAVPCLASDSWVESPIRWRPLTQASLRMFFLQTSQTHLTLDPAQADSLGRQDWTA
jgi:hypothetical protein